MQAGGCMTKNKVHKKNIQYQVIFKRKEISPRPKTQYLFVHTVSPSLIIFVE